MRNQQLVYASRKCSSTPVGFGQGFLSKEQCDNTGTSPILSDFYLFCRLKSGLEGQRFCDTTDIIKNATEELKGFHKMASRNISNTFIGACRSVYLHKGAILKKCNLKVIAHFLYFSEIN